MMKNHGEEHPKRTRPRSQMACKKGSRSCPTVPNASETRPSGLESRLPGPGRDGQAVRLRPRGERAGPLRSSCRRVCTQTFTWSTIARFSALSEVRSYFTALSMAWGLRPPSTRSASTTTSRKLPLQHLSCVSGRFSGLEELRPVVGELGVGPSHIGQVLND